MFLQNQKYLIAPILNLFIYIAFSMACSTFLMKTHIFRICNPTFFSLSSKLVKFGLKSLKMVIFSIFQLWHLKTLKFSSYYHFWWFCWPFRPLFWKNNEKFKFKLFWIILRKTAICVVKWGSDRRGLGQMAWFGLGFHPET